MGYYAAGHVLLAEPNVAGLDEVVGGLYWSVYKAKDLAVWLLDTFPTAPGQHGPFSEYIWRGGDDAELARAVPGYGPIMKAMTSFKQDLPYTAWLLLSRGLSQCLRDRVFTFLSDDDAMQMTCICDKGDIVRVHCEYGQLDMVYESGKFLFRPLISLEDPVEPNPKLVQRLSGLEAVELGRPVTIPEGGRPVHDILLRDWPREAGDPAQLLDIGTGDDFLDLESRFALVASGRGKVSKATSPVRTEGPKTRGFWQRLFGG